MSSDLTVQTHSYLSEYVIQLLKKNKIFTVQEFLEVTIKKLNEITNLSFKELYIISKDLSEHFALKAITDLESNNTVLGIESFDNLLKNENLFGKIIEFCGNSGMGKTQICLTIAINFSQKFCYETLFIDTKKDFSALRMEELLLNTDKKDIFNILQNIKVERIFRAHGLVQILTSLITSFDQFRNLKLIIIDSLPSLWFLFSAGQRDLGLKMLLETSNLLQTIAHQKQIIIIIVNITTGKFIDNFDGSLTDVIEDPALGKYYLHIPTHRFLLSENSHDKFDTFRIIKVIKSTTLKTGIFCKVNLTDKGVI